MLSAVMQASLATILIPHWRLRGRMLPTKALPLTPNLLTARCEGFQADDPVWVWQFFEVHLEDCTVIVDSHGTSRKQCLGVDEDMVQPRHEMTLRALISKCGCEP